jgi:DNA-binding LytR/AlgR family response regulator
VQKAYIIAQNLYFFRKENPAMLRIALCDDDERLLQDLKELLELYMRQNPDLDGEIQTFCDGNELLQQSQKKSFQLYLLDILMPVKNGIEISRELRAMGISGEIIFLTSSNDFASDSYDVHAFFYLLKPVQQVKLFQVLDKAVEKLQRKNEKAIVVSTAEGPRRILLEHIRYIERVGRCMRYYCTDGNIDSKTIRTPFRQMVQPLLEYPCFILCGASFLINLQHITGVTGRNALLDNGETLPLPRTAAAAFKISWGKYWLDQMEGEKLE